MNQLSYRMGKKSRVDGVAARKSDIKLNKNEIPII